MGQSSEPYFFIGDKAVRKIFVSLVLLALLSVVACGDNGDSGSGSFGSGFERDGDNGSSANDGRSEFERDDDNGSSANSGRSGFGGGRMTVEEYAAACANLEEWFGDDPFDDFSEPGDFNEVLGFMEDFQKEIDSWNPPSELEELHGIRREGVGFVINFLKETGMLELALKAQKAEEEGDVERLLELAGEMVPMESQMEEMEAEMEAFDDRLERAEDRLSPETYDILYAADCI